MKVTLSTGQGQLHFVETSQSLCMVGLDHNIITVWIPKQTLPRFVNLLGPLLERDKLHQRLSSRRTISNSGASICRGLFWPETYINILYAMARFGWYDRSKASARGWRAFGRATVRHLDGDIFHVRSGAGQGGAIAAAKHLGMKVVVDQSLAHPTEMERNLKPIYEATSERFTLGPSDPFWKVVLKDCDDADVLLVNSDYVKQTFVDQGYDSDRIVVAYLGVRRDFLDLKDSYTLAEDGRLRLLFTGGFALRKGANLIIDAVEKLDAAGVDCFVEVAGHADEGRRLLRTCPAQIHEKFIFHGFIPQHELKALFKRADMYVFPSAAEGCAKSAMEAMAAGVPVICTAETGTPIEVGSGRRIVPRGDSQALADAILELGRDKAMREHMGQVGSQYVRTHLSWMDYGGRLKQLYQGLVKSD